VKHFPLPHQQPFTIRHHGALLPGHPRPDCPNQESVAPQLAIPARAQFEIPVGDNGSAWIDCQCNVVTVRRVARDCFHVGMSFTSFEEDGGALVDRYISEQLATDA